MILRFMLLTIIVMASIINFGLNPMVEASSPSHAFIALERGITPHSINDAGICAGVWATKDMSLAVKLLPNGKIVKLAREQSAAYDIANNGTIVGQLGRAAHIWEADGTAVAPISHGYQSAATAINASGTMIAGNMIMVSRTDSIPGNHAFRLIRRGNDWSAGIIGAGSVYAINDNGRSVGQTKCVPQRQ
jgi:hypothetical protein